MPKSDFAAAVDWIQQMLRPLLKTRGFKVRGRTFNRPTEDGLTQVVNIQMGPSDPPGTTYIPRLRGNLYGLFAVNLGVYVPEVARYRGSGEAGSWVQDYYCCVRSRLSPTHDQDSDSWWHARADLSVVNDISSNLELFGFPFLDRFGSREKILTEWRNKSENIGASSPPRIVLAIILATRGDKGEARRLLTQQALETRNPGHPQYVRELASALSVGELDG